MSISLSSLKEQVRHRANMENSDFIEDSELTYYINLSYSELYDIIVSKFEDYHVKGPVDFTLSGSSSYDLPEDFYKLLGIDKKLDANSWFEVKQFMFNKRNAKNLVERFSGIYPESQYRIFGNKVMFVPEDLSDGDYRIWYIPRYSKLVEDTDVLDGVNGWEEYIIIDAAIKCLIKEESDISALVMQKNSMMQRIEEMAANRDAGDSQTVSDVNYDHSRYMLRLF